jgi:hypothetical protein
LSQDDDDLERIWKSEYGLSEFVGESNFKSYDELKARLDKVLGLDGSNDYIEKPAAPVVAADRPKKSTVEDSKSWTNDDEDDEGLSYFEKLAEDD